MWWIPKGSREMAPAYAAGASIAGLMAGLSPEMLRTGQGWIIVAGTLAVGAFFFRSLREEWQRVPPAAATVGVLGVVAFATVHGCCALVAR